MRHTHTHTHTHEEMRRDEERRGEGEGEVRRWGGETRRGLSLSLSLSFSPSLPLCLLRRRSPWLHQGFNAQANETGIGVANRTRHNMNVLEVLVDNNNLHIIPLMCNTTTKSV